MTQGLIMNYRGGKHTQVHNQMILDFNTDMKKAGELVGKNIQWKTPSGKIIKGQITAVHGNSGRVRALFERGLPGQAIGTKVEMA